MNRAGPDDPRATSARATSSRAPAGVSLGRGWRRWLPPIPTRWLVTGGIALGACVLIAVGLLVVYPRVGATMIRDRLGGKVAGRLGREVQVGSIDVSLGHAVLRDVEIRGRND